MQSHINTNIFVVQPADINSLIKLEAIDQYYNIIHILVIK